MLRLSDALALSPNRLLALVNPGPIVCLNERRGLDPLFLGGNARECHAGLATPLVASPQGRCPLARETEAGAIRCGSGAAFLARRRVCGQIERRQDHATRVVGCTGMSLSQPVDQEADARQGARLPWVRCELVLWTPRRGRQIVGFEPKLCSFALT